MREAHYHISTVAVSEMFDHHTVTSYVCIYNPPKGHVGERAAKDRLTMYVKSNSVMRGLNVF